MRIQYDSNTIGILIMEINYVLSVLDGEKRSERFMID